ncbi:MAG: MarR family transcriptional regulator [Nocardioides sp.]
MAEDWVDRHVARWRDHWIDIHFDDEVEGVVERIGAIARYLRSTKKDALADTGLQDFEYDTLHMLMIRDTPGHASPTDLAADLGVSPAGMTGRLDGLEKAGWIQRRPSAEDRRRIDIEVTHSGADIWRRAIARRGNAEEELVGVLSADEQRQLNVLLKKMTLTLEPDAD